MARKGFQVDWSDAAFPAIVRMTGDEPGWVERFTFAQAKLEIITSMQNEIQHARMIIAQVRKLKAADITQEYGH